MRLTLKDHSQHEPDLWIHLLSCDIQPTRVVFRWIQYLSFIVCIFFFTYVCIYLLGCFLFRCFEYLLTAILNEVNNKMPKMQIHQKVDNERLLWTLSTVSAPLSLGSGARLRLNGGDFLFAFLSVFFLPSCFLCSLLPF